MREMSVKEKTCAAASDMGFDDSQNLVNFLYRHGLWLVDSDIKDDRDYCARRMDVLQACIDRTVGILETVTACMPGGVVDEALAELRNHHKNTMKEPK